MFARLHARLGDLWWYTILLFCAQRFADVINMFVGLWIVPRYVPMAELGAVLPLTSVVSVIGLPLAIVTLPLLKFVAVFRERGELGKAKALIRDTFRGVVVFALLSFLISAAVLPFFFERLRIESGSLAFLLVAGTILGAVAGVFSGAVQGLKLYSSTVAFMVIAAPLRLFLMVALMPFRALSGYVVGQNANALTTVGGSVFVLRRFFRTTEPAVPYWREHGRDILRYVWPLAVMTVVTAVAGNLDALVVRHRLSDFESAGYYIVTRFADLSNYLGSAFMIFLVPMLAGRKAGDDESRRLIRQATNGTVATGVLVVLALACGGRFLLGLRPDWAVYSSLVPEMVVLSANTTLTMGILCLTGAFTAQSRFRFLWYYLPLLLAKSVVLYALTGYGFFAGLVPDAWLGALAAFDPCRLMVISSVMITCHSVILVLLVLDFCRRPSEAAWANR